jgi:solute carrier family 25 (mitochondrial folate transporter), member 32
MASGTAWGLYFMIYNSLKSYHHSQNVLKSTNIDSNNRQNLNLTFSNYLMDATIAGILITLVTNPLFLVKVRMCLQYNANETGVAVKKYQFKNSLEAFKSIYNTEGFKGFYRGLLPGLFGTLNGTIQMISYDLMKKAWFTHLKSNAIDKEAEKTIKLNNYHYLLFSSLSKTISVVCTYPFQLIRTRQQDQHQSYKNFLDVIEKTYKNEGLRGFYKGLLPCIVRVTPATCLTFLVYENLVDFLTKL